MKTILLVLLLSAIGWADVKVTDSAISVSSYSYAFSCSLSTDNLLAATVEVTTDTASPATYSTLNLYRGVSTKINIKGRNHNTRYWNRVRVSNDTTAWWPDSTLSLSKMYYVNSATGDDDNTGLYKNPWKTITKAISTIAAGDICFVQGTFGGKNTVSTGGSEGKQKIFVGKGLPKTKAWEISGNWIQLIGFEIGDTLDYSIYGVNGPDNIDIVNNKFQRIYKPNCIYLDDYAVDLPSHFNFLGNKIDSVGVDTTSGAIFQCNMDSSVVWYNTGRHHDDFIKLYGNRNLYTNNYSKNDGTMYPLAHNDGVQHSASTVVARAFNSVVDRNFFYLNLNANSHFFYSSCYNGSVNSMWIRFRQNVSHTNESNTFNVMHMDSISLFNNTFVRPAGYTGGTRNYCSWNVDTTNSGVTGEWAEYGFNHNNLIYDAVRQSGRELIFVRTDTWGSCSTGYSQDYNCAYPYGNWAESHKVTGNPLPRDTAKMNFRFKSGSSCVGTAGPLCLAVGAGTNSNRVRVSKSSLFFDGFGWLAGDRIRVGTASVDIVQIDGDTLVVDSIISWDDNAWVNLWYTGAAPHVGAYDYRTDSTDTAYSITLSGADTINILKSDSTHKIFAPTVVNPLEVRMVKLFANEQPVDEDFDQPYSLRWDFDHADTGLYILRVSAYSNYADTVLWRSDSVVIGLDTTIAYTPPAVLSKKITIHAKKRNPW